MLTHRDALGDILRTARIDARLSLRDVAGRAYISVSYLSEVERGLKDVSSFVLSLIVTTLDTTHSIVFARLSEEMRRFEEVSQDVAQTLPGRDPAPGGTAGELGSLRSRMEARARG